MIQKTSSSKKSGRKGGTVTLPASHTPLFPEKCAICCKSISSASAAKVKVRMDLRSEYGIPFFYLGFYLMRYLSEHTGAFNSGTQYVPAHLWCRNKIGRRSRVKLYILAGVVAFFFLMAFSSPIHYNEARVDGALVFIGLVGALAGVAFVDIFVKPDPVFIMNTSDGIEYRFADEDMAREFAELNIAAVKG